MSSLETLDIKYLLCGDPGNTSGFIKTYGYIVRIHSNIRAFHSSRIKGKNSGPLKKLPCLKTISIDNNDLEAYPLYDLKPLVPSTPDSGRAWRLDQVRSLLEKYLKLRSINPCCLVNEKGSTLRVWIDNECDRKTDFISFCNEGDDEEYQEPDCGEYEDDARGYGNHQGDWY
ncbi:hypothetical protein BGX21_001049 [Mortierella sp. AD011]|nr:hypothetical protein BGX21_001049 [Mortierella sp. AD011]